MRRKNSLFSFSEFLMVLGFFLIGGALVALHFVPGARIELAEWLSNPQNIVLVIGSILIGIAIFHTCCFWGSQKGRFIRVKMENGLMTIEEGIVRALVDHFWKEAFPKAAPPREVFCVNNTVEIALEEGPVSLEEVESRLGSFLAKELGSKQNFYLSLKVD